MIRNALGQLLKAETPASGGPLKGIAREAIRIMKEVREDYGVGPWQTTVHEWTIQFQREAKAKDGTGQTEKIRISLGEGADRRRGDRPVLLTGPGRGA